MYVVEFHKINVFIVLYHGIMFIFLWENVMMNKTLVFFHDLKPISKRRLCLIIVILINNYNLDGFGTLDTLLDFKSKRKGNIFSSITLQFLKCKERRSLWIIFTSPV